MTHTGRGICETSRFSKQVGGKKGEEGTEKDTEDDDEGIDEDNGIEEEGGGSGGEGADRKIEEDVTLR